MKDLVTFLDNNGKSAAYIRGNINGLYRYLDIIGATTTLITSDKLSLNFGPSYSIDNDTEYFQPVVAALRMKQKIICECCERIGHKADVCIIRGTKFLQPSLRININ